MEILFSTSSRAAIMTAVDGERRTVASIPEILEGDESPVAAQAVAARTALSTFAEQASNAVATYNQVTLVERMRDLAVRTLATPVQQLVRAGEAEERAITAAWITTISVPQADAGTAMMRQLDVTAFIAMTNAERAAWIENASVDQLEAIVAAGKGRFRDLPDEIYSRLEERYAVVNIIRTTGTASDYAKRPSLDDPIVTGIDMDAAERAAKEALARHHRRREIIDYIEQTVRGIASVIGLTCAMNLQDAYALVIDGKVPA